MKPASNKLCPCGSQQAYMQCCGLYIEKDAIPTTAEKLMRSRYTAYSQANIAYIQKTMREKAAQGFDTEQAQIWAKSAKWKRLQVLAAYPHPSDATRAFVEFSAYYILQGRGHTLKEISEFKFIEGRWYYVAGVSV